MDIFLQLEKNISLKRDCSNIIEQFSIHKIIKNFNDRKGYYKKANMKKILGKILLSFIIGIVIYVGIEIYQEQKIKNVQISKNNNINLDIIEKEEEKIKKIDLNLVEKKYKGYTVDAKLQIHKLDIDTYVLKEYSKEAMEICVAKYYGPSPNEVGNYCIAGHNYITKNMFSQLRKLEIGDEIILTDNYNGTVYYTVYDKYKVNPEETEVLSQDTNQNIELTLITCSDYSNKRIIIKARAEEMSL